MEKNLQYYFQSVSCQHFCDAIEAPLVAGQYSSHECGEGIRPNWRCWSRRKCWRSIGRMDQGERDSPRSCKFDSNGGLFPDSTSIKIWKDVWKRRSKYSRKRFEALWRRFFRSKGYVS